MSGFHRLARWEELLDSYERVHDETLRVLDREVLGDDAEDGALDPREPVLTA